MLFPREQHRPLQRGMLPPANETRACAETKKEKPMARIVGTEKDDVASNWWDATFGGVGWALLGTGHDDEMYGLGGDDIILGGGGNDYINGGTGEDDMQGGAGNDTYIVDDADDRIVETAAGGTDRIVSFVSFTLPQNVEELTLAATAGAINGTGHVLDETLRGNDFNNTLNGDAGDDFLYGNGGRDTLLGTDGNDHLSGGAQNDDLSGGRDNDTLDGGAGDDVMNGGSGDDTYYVDASGDTVTDSSGYDTVFSWTTFTLPAGVENLILQDFAGAISGTGNASVNAMRGNERNNTLSGLDGADLLVGGRGNDTLLGGNQSDVLYGEEDNDTLNGGTGADVMVGGIGNDIYFVDNAGDRVNELLNEGTDTVNVSNLVNFTLPANVENLVLVTGTNGTGNALVNTITGNLLDNRLDGAGGADTMAGQLGNDTYIVDNANDRVTEFGGQGSDRVQSSVSYTLTAGADVEFLETTNATGTAAINLTGNASGNVIIGNNGRNALNGGGGRDELTGGGGIDLFLFNTPLDAASNVVTITDYSVADDTILLDDAVFTQVTEIGFQIDPAQLVIAATAQDADDRIIYNSSTGALLYDADGTGATAAIQFATLSPGLGLQFFDFAIV
jgi:Ca2+-binding RTX toxin-like protein